MPQTSGQSNDSNQRPAKRGIKRLKIRKQMRGTIHRDESGGNVLPSGAFTGNASGYDLAIAFAEKKGLKVGAFGVGFGIAEGSATVWLYFEPATSDDIVPIRWNDKTHRFSFSLAPLFKDLPTLRPSARRGVPMTETVDDDGVECLAIDLAASLVKAVRTAKKSGQSDAKPTENTK